MFLTTENNEKIAFDVKRHQQNVVLLSSSAGCFFVFALPKCAEVVFRSKVFLGVILLVLKQQIIV